MVVPQKLEQNNPESEGLGYNIPVTGKGTWKQRHYGCHSFAPIVNYFFKPAVILVVPPLLRYELYMAFSVVLSYVLQPANNLAESYLSKNQYSSKKLMEVPEQNTESLTLRIGF